jgi:hypothetical protein
MCLSRRDRQGPDLHAPAGSHALDEGCRRQERPVEPGSRSPDPGEPGSFIAAGHGFLRRVLGRDSARPRCLPAPQGIDGSPVAREPEGSQGRITAES